MSYIAMASHLIDQEPSQPQHSIQQIITSHNLQSHQCFIKANITNCSLANEVLVLKLEIEDEPQPNPCFSMQQLQVYESLVLRTQHVQMESFEIKLGFHVNP